MFRYSVFILFCICFCACSCSGLSAADKTLYDQKNEQKGKVRFYVGEGQYL